jgi:antitoxin VapB
MNKHEPPKAEEYVVSVFKSNRSQAIRIPKAIAFPEGVKKVVIVQADGGLLIKPIVQGSWADYFSRPSLADPDFLADRMQGEAEDREPL